MKSMKVSIHAETILLEMYCDIINTYKLSLQLINVCIHTYTHLGDSLDVSLDTLLLLLREQVSPKWREFGEAVGIDDMVLDSIANTCSPENYFVELLDYWLMYYNGKPTWIVVVEALYDIDLQKLAQDIEHTYETGKNLIWKFVE